MTVEQAVRSRLLATSGVTALVSTRIYQLLLPQGSAYPAVRLQLISEPRGYQLRGEDGAVRSRVQVDSYAQVGSGTDPYDGAAAVAEAIRVALSGQKFTDGGSPAELEIAGCFCDGRRVMYEAEEQRLVRVSQDFIVRSRAV